MTILPLKNKTTQENVHPHLHRYQKGVEETAPRVKYSTLVPILMNYN